MNTTKQKRGRPGAGIDATGFQGVQGVGKKTGDEMRSKTMTDIVEELTVVTTQRDELLAICRSFAREPRAAFDYERLERLIEQIESGVTKRRDTLLDVARAFVSASTQWQSAFYCMRLERLVDEMKDVGTNTVEGVG